MLSSSLTLPLLLAAVPAGIATVSQLAFTEEGTATPVNLVANTITGQVPGFVSATCAIQSSLTLPTGDFYYPDPRVLVRFGSLGQFGNWFELDRSSIAPRGFSPVTGDGEVRIDDPIGLPLGRAERHAVRSPFLPEGVVSVEFAIGGRALGLDALGEPTGVLHEGAFDLTVNAPDVAVDILEPFAPTGAQVLVSIELGSPATQQRDFTVSVSKPGVAAIRSSVSSPTISIPAGEEEAHFFVQTHALGQYRIVVEENGIEVADSVEATVFNQVDAIPLSTGGGSPLASQFGSWFAAGGGLNSMLSISGSMLWEPLEPPVRAPIFDKCYPASVPPAMVYQDICSGCVLFNDIGTVSGPLAGPVGVYDVYSCEDWDLDGCTKTTETLDTPSYSFTSSEMYECGGDTLEVGGSVSLELGPAGWEYDTQATIDWKSVNICHRYSLDEDGGSGTITVDSCN